MLFLSVVSEESDLAPICKATGALCISKDMKVSQSDRQATDRKAGDRNSTYLLKCAAVSDFSPPPTTWGEVPKVFMGLHDSNNVLPPMFAPAHLETPLTLPHFMAMIHTCIVYSCVQDYKGLDGNPTNGPTRQFK